MDGKSHQIERLGNHIVGPRKSGHYCPEEQILTGWRLPARSVGTLASSSDSFECITRARIRRPDFFDQLLNIGTARRSFYFLPVHREGIRLSSFRGRVHVLVRMRRSSRVNQTNGLTDHYHVPMRTTA